jgi:hypothetical protein
MYNFFHIVTVKIVIAFSYEAKGEQLNRFAHDSISRIGDVTLQQADYKKTLH